MDSDQFTNVELGLSDQKFSISTISTSECDKTERVPRTERKQSISQFPHDLASKSTIDSTQLCGTERPRSQTSRQVPVKAIFTDLPTAHSSITSGSARSRHGMTSPRNMEAPRQASQASIGSSLPDIVAESANDNSELAQPSRGVVCSNSSDKSSDISAETEDFVMSRAPLSVASPHPGSLSFQDKEDMACRLFMDGSGLGTDTANEASPTRDHFLDGDLQATEGKAAQSPEQGGVSSSHGSISDEMFLPPDDSTLGDMYARYMQYDMRDDLNDAWRDPQEVDDPDMLTFERRLNTPSNEGHRPEFELRGASNGQGGIAKLSHQPEARIRSEHRSKRTDLCIDSPRGMIPRLQSHSNIARKDDDHRNGSVVSAAPFGNQQALLGVSSRTYLHGNQQPASTCENPFAMTSASSIDGSTERTISDEERTPLERDISSALRRTSTGGTFTDGNFDSQEVFGQGLNLQSDTATFYRHSKLRAEEQAGTLEPNLGGLAEGNLPSLSESTQQFYQYDALEHTWLSTDQQNTVRVPIIQRAYFPESPPITPFDRSFGNEDPDSRDLNPNGDEEWETIGDSVTQSALYSRSGVERVSNGGVKQAGSSLANVSYQGSVAPFGTLDQFHSPRQIPRAHGGYFHPDNGRQRDIEQMHMLVSSPVSRTNQVNENLGRPGLPPSRGRSLPKPLTKHINPSGSAATNAASFTTSNSTSASAKNHAHTFNNHKHKSYFPEQDVLNSYVEKDITEQGIPLQNLFPRITDASRIMDWIDKSEVHKSSSKRQQQSSSLGTGPARKELLTKHIERAARAHNPIAMPDSTPESSSSPLAEKLQLNNKNAGDQQKSDTDIQHNVSKGPIQFIRSLPGAIYRDIRSTSEQRRLTRVNNPGPVHGGAEDDLINAPRPYCFLSPNYSVPDDMAPRQFLPIDGSVSLNQASQTGRHDLTYPSAIGPPRSEEWQMLYTDAQLQRMRETARAAGVYDSQITLTPAVSGQGSTSVSRMARAESPHLYRVRYGIRDPEIVHQERKIAIIVLCLCNFFPPLCLLYATSYLDEPLFWWSGGKFESFPMAQKKVAYWLSAIWGIFIIVGVTCGLSYVGGMNALDG